MRYHNERIVSLGPREDRLFVILKNKLNDKIKAEKIIMWAMCAGEIQTQDPSTGETYEETVTFASGLYLDINEGLKIAQSGQFSAPITCAFVQYVHADDRSAALQHYQTEKKEFEERAARVVTTETPQQEKTDE